MNTSILPHDEPLTKIKVAGSLSSDPFASRTDYVAHGLAKLVAVTRVNWLCTF